MSDRVPSDHPTVETVEASVERAGRTRRPRVALPADAADAVPAGEVVRLVLDGSRRFARFDRPTSGDGLVVRGAYDTPALARSPGEGTNRLPGWVEAAGVDFGGTVLLDVIAPGFLYGLRAPGERVVYEAVEPPDEGLSAIAERIVDEDARADGETQADGDARANREG